MPHNPLGPICTAASIHFCAATNNMAQLEYWDFHEEGVARDLFPTIPRLDGTGFPLPAGPCLGVSFDEEAARDHAFRMWEEPHWRRRDGAYTNW